MILLSLFRTAKKVAYGITSSSTVPLKASIFSFNQISKLTAVNFEKLSILYILAQILIIELLNLYWEVLILNHPFNQFLHFILTYLQ